MTLNKEQLIELLVAKTGLEAEAVNKHLSELVSRIQNAAEEGKNFHIEGFGTFSIRDDVLNFTPAEDLETEVNYKYAGMEPIELMGAFKDVSGIKDEKETEKQPDTEESQISPADENDAGEDIWGIDKMEADISNKNREEQEKEAGEIAKDVSDDQKKEKRSLEDFWIDENRDSAGEEGIKTEDAEAVEEPVEEATTEKAAGTVRKQKLSKESPTREQQKPKIKTTGKRRVAEEEKDPVATFLMIAVIIIAIVVGGWLLYDMGVISNMFNGGDSGSRQASTGITQTQPQNQEPVATGTNEQDAEEAENDQTDAISPDEKNDPETETGAVEPDRQNQVTNEQEEADTGRTSAYGLMGRVVAEGNDGYTIIVHSLKSETRARNQVQKLRADGYRTILTKAVVNNVTQWRIGIGQFERVTDAQKAAESLPEPYNENFFIKRIK